jgi:orotate phosphoribosyltransferase
VRDEAALRDLLLRRSVRHGDFLLASGRRSSFYIDCRPSTMSAEGLVLIGRLAWRRIRAEGWRPTAVGGLTMGADPVAYAIAAASALGAAGAADGDTVDAFSVRTDVKSHGTGRLIEGNFRPGDPVVIVEDVITTGASAQRAIEVVQGAGGIILGVLAVVDREEGGRESLEREGRKVVALTTAKDLGLTTAESGRA